VGSLVARIIRETGVNGSILDFGAGHGNLLTRLHREQRYPSLAGVDLFPRPLGLASDISWYVQDLNDPLSIDDFFDTVICSEVIEHLENPRHTFRLLSGLVRRGGTLILTMPNQECIRSFAGLLFGGHFTSFLGSSYPAHITALLRRDLCRLCAESGFSSPRFYYSDSGAIPKLTWLTWQEISFGLLRGRLVSDNIGMIATRVVDDKPARE
jgi:2-polyprenyl-3-methyl-5-hydroxy-6-metoxy-1,4-benzoquinol methylase